ncbi:MAG: hypothetical protein R3275_07065 [Saprospiraceae bacterium]|nr:hypothetical protein [Saprospiraceae bacterium]
MTNEFIHTSLTRITDLKEREFKIENLPKSEWENADYVVLEILDPGNGAKIELSSGRHMDPLAGEKLIGALGVRHATLETTGTWEIADPDKEMDLLTGAGLAGKVTSVSPWSVTPIRVTYLGHVMIGGRKTNMRDYLGELEPKRLITPVILITGTSMSAGKTTVARIIVNELVGMGHKVLGAKLTGAGRYRDILAMKDAGASEVVDFVDGGIPSSIVSEDDYNLALDHMLSRMAQISADVAVVEIGASPFEPYNGSIAIDRIKELIRYKVICTADPYAVYGVMRGFNFYPDLVSGPCTNTIAAKELVEKLTEVEALNLLNPENRKILRERLAEKIG